MTVDVLTVVEGAGGGRRGMPSVYMAGSMGTEGEGDWRQDWRPARLPDVWSRNSPVSPVPIAEMGFVYVGPFGDSMLKHSCRHGLNFGVDVSKHIFTRSLEQLRAADFVVALIDVDKVTCYGTLAEIGYAHGLGIPIYMTLVSERFYREPQEWELDDYDYEAGETWFVQGMAKRCVRVHSCRKRQGAEVALRVGVFEWRKRTGRQSHANEI